MNREDKEAKEPGMDPAAASGSYPCGASWPLVRLILLMEPDSYEPHSVSARVVIMPPLAVSCPPPRVSQS